MVRLLTLIFLTLTVVPTYADALYNYSKTLALESSTVQWVESQQPTLSSTDTSLIANHLLFNAASHDIPVDLLVGLITVESRFNAKAKSPYGAQGITQVVPRYHRAKIKGRNIFDPRVGIEVGTLILRECLDRFNDNRRQALYCYSGYHGHHAIQYLHAVESQASRFRQQLALSGPQRTQQLAYNIDSNLF